MYGKSFTALGMEGKEKPPGKTGVMSWSVGRKHGRRGKVVVVVVVERWEGVFYHHEFNSNDNGVGFKPFLDSFGWWQPLVSYIASRVGFKTTKY